MDNRIYSQYLQDLLIIDIETATSTPKFDELPEKLQKLWTKKALRLDAEKTAEELYWEKGAIFAEYGKIISIAAGFFYLNNEGELSLRVKAFKSDNELELLTEFKGLLDKSSSFTLVGHNAKEFDFPYLGRRMLINEISLPKVLDIAGKKPWEIHHIDTMELWKFGDYKNYSSLDLLATIFGIESSKDDIDGSQVNGLYYEGGQLENIAHYCMKDVEVTAKVYLKLKGLGSIKDENIELVMG